MVDAEVRRPANRPSWWTWPGDPDGRAELWAINHDCLHVLSGYSTSAQGELLVAAFTGGQFDPHVDFMESHVLPTIMNYHLGIETNKGLNAGDKTRMEADPDWADNYEGYVRLGLDAAKLWVAIARGRATTENLYSGHWDSWTHAPEPLEDLRSRWSFRRRTRPWPPSTTTRRRSPTARGCVATALQ